MKNIINNIRNKLRLFMQGRYGFDELSKLLLVVALLCMVIVPLQKIFIFRILALLLIIFTYYRCFSKNHNARRKELQKYNTYKKMWSERKTHKFIKCKNCKTMLRIPKVKGNITITCTVCNNKISKKL